MVFISYSSKDIDNVRILAKFIETTGKKCWYSDRNLDKSKEDWMDLLIKAIKESDFVLLFLTKNAIESGEVKNEIANASAEGKNVIPYIAENVKMPESYMYLIRKYEWINAFSMSKSSALEILRQRLLENVNEIRAKFWNTLQKEEFNKFVHAVLAKYYGISFFSVINNQEYGVYCVPARMSHSAKDIKAFDELCDYENSELADFEISSHQTYNQNKWYAEYSNILDGKIRFPDRPGYMLDEITTDGEGYFDKLRVHVGTFAENVYSTHVLEYELYKAFLEFKDSNLDNPEICERLKEFLQIRNKMHQDVFDSIVGKREDNMRHSLLKGVGRDSLLSVQMLVVVKSRRTHDYEVKIIQRSNDVVIKPGIYQFIPSGGFEILNDSDDNVYDDLELVENFSPGCAIFREYLEELFNVPEFEGGGTGSIEERLLKDPRITTIERMLKEGKAELQFLGSVIDLAGLRHELSFVLVIHDEAYSEAQFLANEESKKGAIYNIPIQQFNKNVAIWKKLHGPSAAMWHLFQHTSLFESLLNR